MIEKMGELGVLLNEVRMISNGGNRVNSLNHNFSFKFLLQNLIFLVESSTLLDELKCVCVGFLSCRNKRACLDLSLVCRFRARFKKVHGGFRLWEFWVFVVLCLCGRKLQMIKKKEWRWWRKGDLMNKRWWTRVMGSRSRDVFFFFFHPIYSFF